MTLLLDASVWLALALPEEPHAEAVEELFDSTHQTVALQLTLVEVANVLGSRIGAPERAHHLAGAIAKRCSNRLLPVDLELLSATLAAAAEHGLTAYDGAYVAAARRHGWQLVSIDHRDLVSKGLAVTPDAALYP